MPRGIEARLLEMVGEIQGLLELEELQEALLVALDRAVPSDWLSVNLMGPGPGQIRTVVRPALSEQQHAVFARLGHENPLAQRYARTRDARPYRFSDVVSREELHALALYREFYAEVNVEFQIAFVIQTSPASFVAVALCRAEHDYTDDERTLLDRARPHLVQIYRNALAYGELSAERRSYATGEALVAPLIAHGLTARPATVLSRVAHGQSNADIAAELGISERTVGKHLQRCYGVLGVASRSQAAAVAWALMLAGIS
jgi:DNA-binding CsgD family transcriptional regulator